MISSVLIANRGEIACRIIRTARRMGIRTIAVYSEVEPHAAHVELADEAYLIGAAPAAQSYLDADKLLEVAKASGAEAIHPGYGFLSENANFASRVTDAGMTWVGPPASAIEAMGLKDAAKALMEKASVPVVPGYHGKNQDDEFLAEQAEEIGYPVLIKAVAGGGGKGMRRVDDPARFGKELKAARREAKSAFGDDNVLIEKYVSSPRHIEIQVFADTHGNAVHLFERDCSIQRRHQKVVEEAPAPGMTEEMRAAMGAAATDAAKAVGYEGAGTVEFIVDASDGLRADRFYFMEMNTRLQVEHPVTEMISGQDLVEWQFRVASGEPLPLLQDGLAINGHALEVRLYAEDPAKKFFPSPGVLHYLKLPRDSAHIRIDTGVRSGDEVTMFYDPMIAKVITWGHDRDDAIRHMLRAISRIEIIGLKTNAAFLAEVVGHAAFRNAELDTAFIERHHGDLIPETEGVGGEVLALAALYCLLTERQATLLTNDPFSSTTGWRLNASEPLLSHPMAFESPDGPHALMVGFDGEGIVVESEGERYLVHGELSENGSVLSALVGSKRVEVPVRTFGPSIHIYHESRLFELERIDPLDVTGEDAVLSGDLTAPMTGKIIAVNTEAGARVRKGDPLVVLEAMKMEHTLHAPADHVVFEVLVRPGDQVDDGAVVVVFDKEDG
jgi:3-methylcrotonyl-CoA carboxylase alpha subunit